MADNSRRPLGPKSSIVSHSFPSFYACYLLRSIQTPKSQATYIGSSPSPPRRIRQHNGEITAGAWKTKNKRPWVMHMIVHGFPSRLAALQFEWAWQHPHLSRHLRDASGNPLFTNHRQSKHLKLNIQIVRLMISNHPYITWPLHVKLFTEEAVKWWSDASKSVDTLPFPPGFTYSIELEGVDGKSDKVGSGRKGPINVKDEVFTSAYLAKNTALLATKSQLTCSVCSEPITNYTTEALGTTLCPTSTCTAVSHLTCLSNQFLQAQDIDTGLVPRGGSCGSCHTYTLWGDIVRGCYRRSTGGTVCEPDDEDIPEDAQAELYVSDLGEDIISPTSSPNKKSVKSTETDKNIPKTRKPRSKKPPVAVTASVSNEGEHFDFCASSTDEGDFGDTPMVRDLTKKRKFPKSSHGPSVISQHILLPKKRGRPRKIPLEQVQEIEPPTTRATGKAATPAKPKGSKSRAVMNQLRSSDESGEFFDFGGIDEGPDTDDEPALALQLLRKKMEKDPRDVLKPRRQATGSPKKLHQATPKNPIHTSAKHMQPAPGGTFELQTLHGMNDDPGGSDAESDLAIHHEDVLMRAMSSLSVSSPAASPKHHTHEMDIIEISD